MAAAFELAPALRLELRRRWYTPASTTGELSVDGRFECFTLEDVVRPDPVPETPQNEAKVPGKTAIPAGLYRVIVTFSNRFQRDLPLLLNVPGFEGVRIHCGNTAADTAGCILVADAREQNRILKSRVAFDRLFPRLEAAARNGLVTLSIVNGDAA